MTGRPILRPTYLLVGLVVLAIAVALANRWSNPPFTPPPLPVPNGYDHLLTAAAMIPPRTGFYDEMEAEELTAIVARNKPALALARKALEEECVVPIDWSHNLANGANPVLLDQASAMRNLARAFAADMRDKLAHQQTDEAVSAGIDMFRLGKQCGGGLMVNYLVGLAVQSTAIDKLRQVVVQDQTARAEILKRLVPLLETGERADEVIQREIQYVNTTLRGFRGWILRRHFPELMEPAVEATQQAALRNTAQKRLFVLHLALHAYRDEHGSWPDALTALSPEIVCIDPYSTAPFVYRVENDVYRLYGVGENGVDDGGEGDETGQAPDFVYDLTSSEQ